jgi:hypothetical protein
LGPAIERQPDAAATLRVDLGDRRGFGLGCRVERETTRHDEFLQRLAASIAWIEQQRHVDDALLTEE